MELTLNSREPSASASWVLELMAQLQRILLIEMGKAEGQPPRRDLGKDLGREWMWVSFTK